MAKQNFLSHPHHHQSWQRQHYQYHRFRFYPQLLLLYHPEQTQHRKNLQLHQRNKYPPQKLQKLTQYLHCHLRQPRRQQYQQHQRRLHRQTYWGHQHHHHSPAMGL